MHTKLITLSDQKTISALFGQGVSVANRLFVVRAQANGLDVARFVFAVGKRYGNAVRRNKIKRQVREIMRQNMDIIESGFDYGVIPRRGCLNQSFGILQEELLDCFARVSVLGRGSGL